MQARDVMTTRVITVGPDTDIAETAKCLLENRISAVPVVEPDGRIVGIVSEGDLMRRSESGTERRPSWWLSLLLLPEQKAINYVKTHGRCARDVMTREVITVNEGATLEQIAETLEKHRIKRVPVVRDGKLVGIVSRANLLHGLVASQIGASPSMDDRKIKAAVEKNLADAGVRAQFLNIVVSGGVVHVWGVVVTPQEQAAVQVAAENAPGAKEVRANVDALPSYMRIVMRAG
jgi:CBS domain-containing protein